MIQSKPKTKNNKQIYISFIFIFLTVIIFMISPMFSSFAFVAQLIAITCATYSLFILIKYVIPDYLYTLDRGKLTIHKITKSQSICVADIDISSIVTSPLTFQEYNKNISSYSVKKVVTFIKNPKSEDLRYIIFNDGLQNFAIIIEPDKLFLQQLSDCVENINYNTENEDYDD